MAQKNVLIYEKDDKFLKALKLYFRGSAYDAESAATEADLLNQARQKRPDIVLLAVESDDGEARALLARVRALGLPIVVMSGKKDENELFSGGLAAVGAHGYIKKPFIKKAILEKLDDVLASAPAGGGVDLGDVLAEVDVEAQFGNLMPGGGASAGGDEVALSLEEAGPDLAPAGGPAVEAVTAPHRAPAPVHEPVPADVPAELRRLRERVREIEGELLAKTEELKKVEREKEQLDRSVGKKESELIDKIKSLEKANEELEEDVKKRKNLVAQMTASVQQLNEELEEKDRRHDKVVEEWRQQLARLQAEYDGLSEKASNQAHEIEDKADEIARHRRRIEDLEAERNELQTNLEKMTEARNQADQTIARLEDELRTERERIAAGKQSLERGLANLRERLLAELGSARDSLEKGLAAAREAAEAAAGETQDSTVKTLLGR